MDILIDIIVYLIKQFAKTNQPQVRPPTPQELAAHQAPMKQRLEAMQKAVAAQQARTKPKAKPRAAARQAAPAKASLSQPPANRTAPAPPPPATLPPTVTAQKARAALPGLKLPLILGEILAPPLALRDDSEFSIQHSAFSIIFLPFLAASHDDSSGKLWIIAFVVVIWAIQAIAKVAKGNPQAKQKSSPRPPKVPPPLPSRAPMSSRPPSQAMRLPRLSNLHQQVVRVEQAPQVRPPLPSQLGIADLLLANKVINPAQASRIRAELQTRRGGNIPPALLRTVMKVPAIKPASIPARPQPAPPSPPTPVPARAAPAAPIVAPIPSRSTISRWLDARSLRSQFILAQALQPPLALRRKSHLP